MKTKIVIFDRDGVLINYQINKIKEYLEPKVKMSVEKMYLKAVEFGKMTQFPEVDSEQKVFWEKFCEFLQTQSDISDSDLEAIKKFDYLDYIITFDDVQPVLKQLKEKGVCTVILTSTPMTSTNSVLQLLKLKDFIDLTIPSRLLFWEKDSSSTYAKLLEYINSKLKKNFILGEILYIDDQEINTIAAQNAGVEKTYLMKRGKKNDLDKKILASLHILPALIEN